MLDFKLWRQLSLIASNAQVTDTVPFFTSRIHPEISEMYETVRIKMLIIYSSIASFLRTWKMCNIFDVTKRRYSASRYILTKRTQTKRKIYFRTHSVHIIIITARTCERKKKEETAAAHLMFAEKVIIASVWISDRFILMSDQLVCTHTKQSNEEAKNTLFFRTAWIHND